MKLFRWTLGSPLLFKCWILRQVWTISTLHFLFEIVIACWEYLHFSVLLFRGLLICSFMDKYHVIFSITKQMTTSSMLKNALISKTTIRNELFGRGGAIYRNV